MKCLNCETEILKGFGCQCSADDTRLSFNHVSKLVGLWEHTNGNQYRIVGIANTENTNPKYPITVVYVGENQNLWAKTLDDFLRSMSPVPRR